VWASFPPTPKNEPTQWVRQELFGIYDSVSISAALQKVAAGTDYVYTPSNPDIAELIDLVGDGTPNWVFNGTDVTVRTSRHAKVIAALIYDDIFSTLTVIKWTGSSPKIEWTYTITQSIPAELPLAVSDDGSTIVVLSNKLEFANPNQTRVHIFDSTGGPPRIFYGINFPRHIVISGNGRYAAIHESSFVYVIDTKTNDTRWISEDLRFSDTALAISKDAGLLAFGFNVLFVYAWDTASNTYKFKWQVPSAGQYYVGEVDISDQNEIFVGWSAYAANQNYIQFYDSSSPSPLWTYIYGNAGGQLQDIVWAVAVDNGYGVVGSWGNQTQNNPQVRVFHRSSKEPIYTYYTPGSIFDVDILYNGKSINVVAGCKATHANIAGRGGFLYSFALPLVQKGEQLPWK